VYDFIVIIAMDKKMNLVMRISVLPPRVCMKRNRGEICCAYHQLLPPPSDSAAKVIRNQ